MKARGELTQDYIYAQTGISPKQQIAIEKGRVSPKVKDLEAILEVAGWDVQKFFESSVPRTLAESEHGDIYALIGEFLDSADTEAVENFKTVVESLLRLVSSQSLGVQD